MDDLLRDQQHQAEILERLGENYDENTVYPLHSGAWIFYDWVENVGAHEAVQVLHEVKVNTQDESLRKCVVAVLDELELETTGKFITTFMKNMCGHSFQVFVEEELAKRIV